MSKTLIARGLINNNNLIIFQFRHFKLNLKDNFVSNKAKIRITRRFLNLYVFKMI